MTVHMLTRIWTTRNPKLITKYLDDVFDKFIDHIHGIRAPELIVRKWCCTTCNEEAHLKIFADKDYVLEALECGKHIILLCKLMIALKTQDWDEGDIILKYGYPRTWKSVQLELGIP